ncbi:MAG: AraC family transcriptional regulator [Bacteroidales bacterium]|nr:AraC family transcriptional regulator [Bacteroidales bacterium]
MANNKLEKLTFSDLPDSVTPFNIRNIIITNNSNPPKYLSLDHPFSFDGIIFIICMKGRAKVRISFEEYEIKKNSIATVLPNQSIEGVEYSKDYSSQLLVFSPDFFSGLPLPKEYDIYKKIVQSPVLQTSEEGRLNLLRYYSFITETFNNKKHQFSEKIIKGLVFSLLLEITALYLKYGDEIKERNSSRNEKITEQFFSLLKKHYKERKPASFYADELFITPKYLSSILKKVTGRPVSAWIEDSITIRAKILLKSTELTVLQISEELNFPNPSYFGRFFKKKTGMTPRDYRES